MKISEKKKKIFSLFVIASAYFWSNFHKLSMSVLAPHLVQKYNISMTQIGQLGSILFFIYAILQIPLGKLADKFGGKIIFKFELLFLTVGTFIFATANSYPKLLIGRFLIGLSIAGFYIPGINLITKWFDIKDYGFYTGIFLSFGLIGALFSSAPLEFLISKFSFESIFLIFAILAGIDFVLVFFIDPGKKDLEEENKKEVTIPKPLLRFAIFCGFYGLVFLGSRQAFSGTWANAYYTSIFKMDNRDSSLMLMLFSIGGIVTAPFAGKSADKFGRYKTLIMMTFITAGLWIFMAFMNFSTPIFFKLFVTFFLGGFSNVGISIIFSVLLKYTNEKNRSTINGIVNSFSIMGASIFTQLLGIVFEGRELNQNTFFKIFMLFSILIIFTISMLMQEKKKLDKYEKSAN